MLSPSEFIAEYERRQAKLDGCLTLYISANLLEKSILDCWIKQHREYLQTHEVVYATFKKVLS